MKLLQLLLTLTIMVAWTVCEGKNMTELPLPVGAGSVGVGRGLLGMGVGRSLLGLRIMPESRAQVRYQIDAIKEDNNKLARAASSTSSHRVSLLKLMKSA